MLRILNRISKEYQTPYKLRRNSQKEWGLNFEDAIEMSYENIQNDARMACKGVKEIKIDF